MQNNLRNSIKKNFTIIPNALISDSSISDRARFVFCLMASKPDDWSFFNSALARELGYSVETLRKYIKELIANGWIVKVTQSQDENGKFSSNSYELLSESSKAPNSTVAEKTRHGENPTRENPDTYKEVPLPRSKLKKKKEKKPSIASQKTKEKSSEVLSNFEIFWKAYPRHKNKGQARKAFIKLNPDDDLLGRMLDKIEELKLTPQWNQDSHGKFIPYPATWIHAEGWEDESSIGFKPSQQEKMVPRTIAEAKFLDQQRMAQFLLDGDEEKIKKVLADDEGKTEEIPDDNC